MVANGANNERVPLAFSDLPSHAWFAQDPPDELHHYTSLQGAYGIITSKQLRLTKVQFLNDTSELVHSIKLFQQTVRDWPNRLATEAREFLDQAAHQLDSFVGINIFVASFCAEHDLLSQWRAYGAGTKGVSLGFSGKFLKDIASNGQVRTWRCIYEAAMHDTITRELVSMLLNCFDMARSLSDTSKRDKFLREIPLYFNTTFLQTAPIMKHSAFQEEREWRIISAPIATTSLNYDVVLSGSRLMPVYKLTFPTENGSCNVLKSVCVGPASDAELISEALFSLLGKNGYVSYSGRRSTIPYRSTS